MPASKEEKKRVEKAVKADFAKLEAKLAKTNPGILDLLQVYGGYECAFRQMNNYLEIIQPEPRFDTTDGTSVLSK